jgi:tRNA-guanine family transglycosylase
VEYAVKYYIAWKPESPDVKYWDWFQPDGILLSFSKFSGILLRRILATDIHGYLGFPGEIFIDGGSYGYPNYTSPYTQREILDFQMWIRPNRISTLDRPYVRLNDLTEQAKWSLLKSSIENARAAAVWEDEKERGLDVVYTVQGWDFDSVTICTKRLAGLGRKHYALGSLIQVQPEEAVRRIVQVRQILGRSPTLHLFGISTPRVLNKVRHLIDSFDSAAPAMAAVYKEIVTPFLRRIHIDSERTAIRSNCDCPVCRDDEISIRMKGLDRQSVRFNFGRMVHNAYFYTQYAHMKTA